MAIMKNESLFIGTELKLNINIEPIGDVTMEDYDWQVDVYCSTKRIVTIPKTDAIKVDSSNYIIRVNTEELGAGELKCKVTAHIPDADFEDGIRNEIAAIDTGITIIKAL